MTCSHKAEQSSLRIIHRIIRRITESRFQSRLALTGLELHAKSVMQFDIVAVSTCLVKSTSFSLVGFLPSVTAFKNHCLYPEEHCVDVFHSSKPSSAPNPNSSCGVHPHVSLGFPSPVQENTLQAKHLRCCTHKSIILRLAGAGRNLGLSFAVHVLTVLLPASTHNQKHSSGFGCSQHGPYRTKILHV